MIQYSKEYLMKEALKNIADPISYLQKEAEKQGGKLDGAGAIYLANNANWLQEIARECLNKVTEIELEQARIANGESKSWEDFRESAYNAWKNKQDEQLK